MNSKIKELALQAGAGEWGDSVVPAMIDIEKFAELIIEECQNVISDVYREMPLEPCGWLLHLEEKILNRFYTETSLEPCRMISQLDEKTLE